MWLLWSQNLFDKNVYKGKSDAMGYGIISIYTKIDNFYQMKNKWKDM